MPSRCQYYYSPFSDRDASEDRSDSESSATCDERRATEKRAAVTNAFQSKRIISGDTPQWLPLRGQPSDQPGRRVA